MIKLIILIVLIFIFLKNINKFILQVYYQNIIFFFFLLIYYIFPVNNLNFWLKIYNINGLDFYSWGLIILTYWIITLIILSSNKIIYNYYYYIYVILINFIIIILFLCFSSLNIIIFYIYFESRLIPIFLLILGWGYQIERILSGFYIILYTLFGSIPLFLLIINLYLFENSLIMNIILIKKFNFLIYISIITAFLIKIPLYIVHLWLPKAHVESPVVGSIILAGIILKLGGYGMIRVITIIIEISLVFNKFFIVIRLMGGLIRRLICLFQVDIKLLVAYSSIVHIRVLISSIITISLWGYIGAYLIIISHGLCSSGIFYLVNIAYERFISRSLYINKGLINYFPSLSLIWFLLCSSNLSFPPSLNLFREIIILNSLIIWGKILIFILIFLLFFRAAYSLYLYRYRQHGKLYILNFSLKNIIIVEFLVLLLHWIPLNLIFFIIRIFI